MKKLKKLLKSCLTPQFIRFVFVAALNTAFGWCVYALLLLLMNYLELDKPFVWASLLGTIISVLFNFKTYGHIVFKNKSNKLIFKFILVYTFNYFLNIGGIALLEILGINNYLAGAITAVPVGLIGYILNKYFVYNTSTIKQ